MKDRKKSPIEIDARKLLEHTIGELLNIDYDLLRYRILVHIKWLRNRKRMLEETIRELSGETGESYGEDYIESLRKKLEDIKKDIEIFKKIISMIEIFNTIGVIEKELRDGNKELWNSIEKRRLKDLLDFKGEYGDKVTVYNYLVCISKGLQVGGEEPEVKTVVKKEQKKQLTIPSSVSVSEKDYINMNVEEWINLLNKCFAEEEQIELPDNYLAESLRRPLKNLITAMLELPPEKLRRVIPKKYKYLLTLHNILYIILKENKEYVITPSSSDKEYIEGEGGIFDIFQINVESEEATNNTRKKTCRIKIGEREYRIVKEILLEQGRAKQIRYIPVG